MTKTENILNNHVKQLLEDYFVISKEVVGKMQEIQELSENSKPEELGKLKKVVFEYNLYNLTLVKNISKIRNSYLLSKLTNTDLTFTLDSAPEGVPTNVEEIIEKILESDPEMVGVVDGELKVLDSNIQDVIDNRIGEISPEELAQVMTKRDEKTK